MIPITHEIWRNGRVVDIWDELGPADASEVSVRSFDVARTGMPVRKAPITVVIQRGHCFRKTGSTGAPGEQVFNDRIARLVAEEAEGYVDKVGHNAVIINADVATYPPGNFFIAQHYDGSTNPRASGASIGYDTAAGEAVGARWKAAYKDLGWTRGFRPDNYTSALSGYYGYRKAKAAGIRARCVIEAGFGSNPGDRAWLDSDRGRTACAAAICIATTGINPLTMAPPEPPKEEDMLLRDIKKFLQATGDASVFLCDILSMTKEGIESKEAREGIAEVWGLDPNVIFVHPDVTKQFVTKQT